MPIHPGALLRGGLAPTHPARSHPTAARSDDRATRRDRLRRGRRVDLAIGGGTFAIGGAVVVGLIDAAIGLLFGVQVAGANSVGSLTCVAAASTASRPGAPARTGPAATPAAASMSVAARAIPAAG